MERLRPYIRGTGAALTRAWHRVRRRLPRPSRLGIAARLAIAFGAVAVLTVAANQIAERGSSLMRAIATAPVVAAGVDDRTAEVLPAALDQYQRAVLARIDSAAVARAKADADAGARAWRSKALRNRVEWSRILIGEGKVTGVMTACPIVLRNCRNGAIL